MPESASNQLDSEMGQRFKEQAAALGLDVPEPSQEPLVKLKCDPGPDGKPRHVWVHDTEIPEDCKEPDPGS